MINIRNADEHDIGELAEIEAECFSVPWSEKSFSDALHMDNTLFLAAEEIAGETGGKAEESPVNPATELQKSGSWKIVGYCGLYQALDEGEITNIAVAVKFRGRQIGGRLLERMLLEAVRRGICKIFLEVRIRNTPAIQLYQKYGFTICGLRKGFYEKPKEDAWLMVWEKKESCATDDLGGKRKLCDR